MAVTAEKLSPTAGFGVDAETHATLKAMIASMKQELKDLQALMVKEQGYLKKLRDDQDLEKRQHKQEMQRDREKFNQELAVERRKVSDIQRDQEQVAKDIETQKRELEILVANATTIRAERDQAVDARIKMEQQRVRAQELKEQADAALHTLHAAEAQLESTRAATAERLAKAERMEKDNERASESVAQQREALKRDLENLTALRTELDPKLNELATKDAQLKEREERLQQGQLELAEHKAELNQARADLDGQAQRLEGKEQQLNNRELRVSQMQSDLNVKLQRAKAKGIEVTDPAETPVSI